MQMKTKKKIQECKQNLKLKISKIKIKNIKRGNKRKIKKH